MNCVWYKGFICKGVQLSLKSHNLHISNGEMSCVTLDQITPVDRNKHYTPREVLPISTSFYVWHVITIMVNYIRQCDAP